MSKLIRSCKIVFSLEVGKGPLAESTNIIPECDPCCGATANMADYNPGARLNEFAKVGGPR